MLVWFLISLIGIIALLPLHFWSVEHTKLDAQYGAEKGKRVGGILGIVSGWGYFLFLFGLWLSPQERFSVPILDIPIFSLNGLVVIYAGNLVISVILLVPGAYLGIKGVTDLGLEASETHRADRVVMEGIYSRIRHPQYLGAFLSHIGISILLSAFYSLLVTPIVILRDFAACRKEEKEMIREFGQEYEDYRRQVPMFIPRPSRSYKNN
jgi:protein-S-isoprenylcysteine O-methyltransferase Ste14